MGAALPALLGGVGGGARAAPGPRPQTHSRHHGRQQEVRPHGRHGGERRYTMLGYCEDNGILLM